MQTCHNVAMVAISGGLVRSPFLSSLPKIVGGYKAPLPRLLRHDPSSGRVYSRSTRSYLTTTYCSGSPPVTLLVGSQEDEASCAMVSALLARGDWLETTPGTEFGGTQGGLAWYHARSTTAMWHAQGGLLGLDDVDHRWADAADANGPRPRPADVIFLSKHVAKSGVPALCVHPIGLPDPLSSNAAGGQPGQCPPPSPRLAACLRELRKATREADLDDFFDVTLEVTHHGPWLETPAMFVETGSSAEYWGRADAAEVWATVLTRMLGLDGSSGHEKWTQLDARARADRTAIVGFGGGHYAPKFGDVARLDDRYVGHMLASYALNFGEAGSWRHAVTEAIQSTRAAFPGAGESVHGGVTALVDKKAFRSADRQALLEHLEALGVEIKFKSSEC